MGAPAIVGSAASLLMQSTGDAMNNIFDVGIVFPWDSGSDGTSLPEVSYRCKGFNPPEDKTKTYDVSWHGITVKKIQAGIDMAREFELTFRMDATYALYNRFKAWKKVTTDVNTGGVANTASALGQVWVYAPGSEYNATASFGADNPNGKDGAYLSKTLQGKVNDLYWLYDSVQVIEVGQPQFSNEATGKAMEFKVKFIFGDVNDPFSTQASS